MIDSVSETAGAAADLKKARRPKSRSRGRRTRRGPAAAAFARGRAGRAGLRAAFAERVHGRVHRKTQGRRPGGFLRSAAPDDLRNAGDNVSTRGGRWTSSPSSNGSRTSSCWNRSAASPIWRSLQDAVPSAANLSYYLEIVQEKYLLRKMIAHLHGRGRPGL